MQKINDILQMETIAKEPAIQVEWKEKSVVEKGAQGTGLTAPSKNSEAKFFEEFKGISWGVNCSWSQSFKNNHRQLHSE